MGAEPPMLIGGLHPSEEGHGGTAGFDAYSATIHANPDGLLDDLTVLLDSAGFEPVVREGLKARFYARSVELVDQKGHQLLLLKSGGSNPHPHMECNGPQAALVAAYLRDRYSHQPTRIDHAIDLVAVGLFDRLHRYARRLCKRHRLKLSFGGDWSNVHEGRTVYIGSRTSQVFVRIYQKGLKMAKDHGLPLTPELVNLVRCELEFKPDTKIARGLASSIIAEQMWGSCNWTRELAAEVLALDTQRVTIREKRESQTEKALRVMGRQYARHGRVLFDQCGGDFCEFGRALALHFGISEADH